MKTLIELYDERAIENVLGVEAFRPEKVYYLCPEEIISDDSAKKTLIKYFERRGLDIEVVFVGSSLYKTGRIMKQLEKIYSENEDCAVDITGGTDAALFAAGSVCSKTEMGAFTYSRKKNMFYDISNAPYARDRLCELEYSVEDFFAMTGGKMREGRVDDYSLKKYMNKFDGFFELFMKYRRKWPDFVTFMQRISRVGEDEPIKLHVSGEFYQKGDSGRRVRAIPGLLWGLQRLGFIRYLKIVEEESVSFRFADEQVRFWLRDVGSVLELYIYKACKDAGIFGDVVSSAIVDWDGTVSHESVNNEIDVVATRGVVPLFISCKATDIRTEALNELTILKERFGGKGAKAAIVTTEYCTAAARHRAAQLGITVIDLEELEQGSLTNRLKTIMHVKIEEPAEEAKAEEATAEAPAAETEQAETEEPAENPADEKPEEAEITEASDDKEEKEGE